MKLTKQFIKELVVETLQTEQKIYVADDIRKYISHQYLKSFNKLVSNQEEFKKIAKEASDIAYTIQGLTDPYAFVAGWVQARLQK